MIGLLPMVGTKFSRTAALILRAPHMVGFVQSNRFAITGSAARGDMSN
jgi:hypothetical protein